jgi:CRP-like cAMP-binding protein
MYFIARGECDVFVTDENRSEKFTANLRAGAYFGEVALLKNCLRTASVFSKNYTT